MDASLIELIRSHSAPLDPRPTTTVARLDRLPGIRAIVFDIYGTLLVSAAGDITLQTGTSSDEVFRAALAACGLPRNRVEGLSSALLQEMISDHHARGKRHGVRFPEVDIVEVWRETLTKIGQHDASLTVAAGEANPERLAVLYECGINPVWPMPMAVACLEELSRRRLQLGIVSNAQAMTPQLFPALLGRSLEDLGFAADLQFFSYLQGESKPGLTMFRQAASVLATEGISAGEVVYVGNDMLKDVWAASQVGFRTILFAGDERSLRLRADNEQVRDCVPDAIVTDLSSIADCLDNEPSTLS